MICVKYLMSLDTCRFTAGGHYKKEKWAEEQNIKVTTHGDKLFDDYVMFTCT